MTYHQVVGAKVLMLRTPTNLPAMPVQPNTEYDVATLPDGSVYVVDERGEFRKVA